ncbi:hypothetical protein RFI_20291 [Reticulomyxa filosa]|uniref:Uncharacterized protein n=1 Tax=Reticulomyxa filosa TaxID=46433 RepID=X6MUC0_RETFI|nr:hypothetical protein RFI_20291 [Reticulomyxa filosa]|eukprot:ETO17042.1 hypothetical protein RFI_20291 [Reticulomyxa filosa]
MDRCGPSLCRRATIIKLELVGDVEHWQSVNIELTAFYGSIVAKVVLVQQELAIFAELFPEHAMDYSRRVGCGTDQSQEIPALLPPDTKEQARQEDGVSCKVKPTSHGNVHNGSSDWNGDDNEKKKVSDDFVEFGYRNVLYPWKCAKSPLANVDNFTCLTPNENLNKFGNVKEWHTGALGRTFSINTSAQKKREKASRISESISARFVYLVFIEKMSLIFVELPSGSTMHYGRHVGQQSRKKELEDNEEKNVNTVRKYSTLRSNNHYIGKIIQCENDLI